MTQQGGDLMRLIVIQKLDAHSHCIISLRALERGLMCETRKRDKLTGHCDWYYYLPLIILSHSTMHTLRGLDCNVGTHPNWPHNSFQQKYNFYSWASHASCITDQFDSLSRTTINPFWGWFLLRWYRRYSKWKTVAFIIWRILLFCSLLLHG